MTIQKAAYEILKKVGKPVSSKELAQIALERKMVMSFAQDPIQSHAQTIEKNIRGGIYNDPELVFIHSSQRRLVGLPGWDSGLSAPVNDERPIKGELKVHVPAELLEKIRLAEQAKLKNNLDETVSLILTKGISILAPDIKKGLMAQIDSLDSFSDQPVNTQHQTIPEDSDETEEIEEFENPIFYM